MKKLSYCCGTGPEPLLYETIGQALARNAEQHPDQDAVIFLHQDVRLSFAGLHAAVERIAGNLLKLGIGRGDRIAIWAPNRVEWVLTQFAAAKIGAILVTINPAYRALEFESVMNKTGVSALVVSDRHRHSDYIALLDDIAPEIKRSQPGAIRCARLPALRQVITLGDGRYPGTTPFAALEAELMPADRARLAEVADKLQPDDAINIQFTSGTTGAPKGITLTHFNILNNGYFMTGRMGLKPGDRLCIPVPLYHCYGMVMGVLGCLTRAAAMVFPDETFSSASVLAAVERERCTALFGVPTMYIAILSDPAFGDYDVSTLRTGNMGAAQCPPEIMRQVIERMNMRGVTISYGMTETSPITFQTTMDDTFERRINSVGRIHSHVQAKIIDGEGRIVPLGQSGELCIRGYSVMQGYWEDPKQTAEAIDGAGWLHTGDLAVFDEDYYCHIVGRAKDMINRAGENISPTEVESFLLTHPKVLEAAVFGVPDDRFGEIVGAWIRLRDGETCDAQEIRAFCKDKIAHFKVPTYIRFVDAFPMTASGKVQRFLIREQAGSERTRQSEVA